MQNTFPAPFHLHNHDLQARRCRRRTDDDSLSARGEPGKIATEENLAEVLVISAKNMHKGWAAETDFVHAAVVTACGYGGVTGV